ncbi:hypothetical protein [Cryptosporangium minutisporangium]|uniref:Uncharacterized protein n=1 Tax=Cryptosporangium minutisporangium TaxID=113569 RepID=A0ABP6TDD2_9ACTN
MDPDELTLESAAHDDAIVAVYRQMFAVLGSSAQSVVSDPVLVDLADALFTAFSAAGSEGLTMEQMRHACRGFPEPVFQARVRVLRELGAVQKAFDRPHQDVYRASFTSYVSLLFIRRMLTRGGQLELHRLLTLERLNLDDPTATDEDARGSAARLTRAFRLIVTELFMLTSGGTIDVLREKAPLLWNADTLIGEATAVHDTMLARWPDLTRPSTELRAAIAAYRDVSTAAAGRLTQAVGATRALDLLPAEAWRTFTRRSSVGALAAPLAGLVFDAPRAWLSAGDLSEAVAQAERPTPQRLRPPRPDADETAGGPEARAVDDAEAADLAARAEAALAGRDAVEVAELVGGSGDWATARRLLADLTAAAQHPSLPYALTWGDGLLVDAEGVPSWRGNGRFSRGLVAG